MSEEKFNFTKAYKEIEEINEWFQGEEMDLDEALQKYERGMELIAKCKERLKEAENKFEEIKKKYSIGE
jgi:exodeoxyribonuclease VII small subunit